ncbi:hypothetical protein BGZ60DRAFT_367144 [Tricladium varicosporioides]|nr:hypothetical protein BGZ60DRAFT_367144 [Hymenoscyphus varicosporioides]
MPTPNKSLILAKNPTGYPIPGEDLLVQTDNINLNASPPEGGLLCKTLSLSYDPYQRPRMRPATKSYVPFYKLGEPISNYGILVVLASSNSRFKKGDKIVGNAQFAEYQIVEKALADKTLHEHGFDLLENPFNLDEKLFLGALGMSGLTAYSSFYEICRPVRGETIFISAASGAVGAIVGQLAKREGLTVIGSVGSDEKLKFIAEELGFDGGFNYKKDNVKEGLKRVLEELGKEGLNIYYDNVGGEMLDVALECMNTFGRIVQCGSISQSSLPLSQHYGIKNMPLVVGKRLTLRGFIVFDPDMGPKYKNEHRENMMKWIKDGEIKVRMDLTRGMERSAEGFVGMLRGANFGKAVLEVAEG